MTKSAALATALASAVLVSGCAFQAPPRSTTRPSIRQDALQGVLADFRVCADGRLLVFPKGHEILC
jgi:PBP1b-binding outer membrane lipoprotein LpoB